MDPLNDPGAPPCPVCGEGHADGPCEALRAAAAAGAQPKGVPLRVYGGYLEARSALRANAPTVAVRVLQWLLSHLAEERGVSPTLTLPAKVTALRDRGVISPNIRAGLIESALSPEPSAETAWALMSVAEHALSRLYLGRGA